MSVFSRFIPTVSALDARMCECVLPYLFRVSSQMGDQSSFFGHPKMQIDVTGLFHGSERQPKIGTAPAFGRLP